MNRFALICLLLASAGGAFAQDNMTWREVDPKNLVFMVMAEGEVVIELNPAFAPKTVAQFKQLVQDDFYRGLSFYRVIDGFVAQGGDESDIDQPNNLPALPAEFERLLDDDLPWARVQKNDLFAAETGFVDGFAAARDDAAVWLTHCPGVIAMARGNEPDSGSTDFYIVIGQAPRYLDRNLTIFGRVIDGMEVVQRIHRGEALDNGIISNEVARSRIRVMRLATDLDAEDAREYYVMDTSSKGFKELLKARRNRRADFFHHKPPEVLDVCQVPVTARDEKASR